MVRPPIELEGVGKQYTKYDDAPMLISAAMRFRSRSKRSKLWAVRDVNLTVAEGSCVGVVGANGSGKSTTLQMLAGVTAPTEGVVRVRGRLAPLISVGVGFHPELTGRENIFVNGSILGMNRREIEHRLDAIVDFAEIPSFIDTPVKFYSSGMFVRLGFSVAIHAQPEILLVDEVLAVGDLAFQLKCFDRMMEIRSSGTTILVVSHNLTAVRKLCDETTVLHRGVQRFFGATGEAISLYHELLDEQRELDDELEDVEGGTVRRGTASILDARLLGPSGSPTAHLQAGDRATFQLEIAFERAITDPVVGLSLANDRNVNVYSDSSLLAPLGHFEAGERVLVEVPLEIPLVTGSYTARFGITDPDDLGASLARAKPMSFYVSGRRLVGGITDLGASFHSVRVPTDSAGGAPDADPAARRASP